MIDGQKLITGRNGSKFDFNPEVFKDLIKKANMKSKDFGKLCGWGTTQQSYVESATTIQLKTMLKIYYAFGIIEGRKFQGQQ